MITIKDEREIELMRHAGMLVSKMHKYLKPFIKFYLYKQQKLFVKDLQNYLYKVSQKEPLYDKQPNLHTKP